MSTEVGLICRACLEPSTKTYPLVGNILNVEIDIMIMLEYCISSKLDLNENLPQRVCLTCFKSIRLAYRFLIQFQESQEKLFKLLNGPRDEQPEEYAVKGRATRSEEYIKTKSDCLENYEYSLEKIAYSSMKQDENNLDLEESYEAAKFEAKAFEKNDISEIENLMSGDTGILEFKYEDDNDIPAEDGSSNLSQNMKSANSSEVEIDTENVHFVKDNCVSVTYKCPICPKEFERHYAFYIHVSSHGSNTIVCTRCPSKVEFDLKEFFPHYKEFHKFQCYICDKRLSSNYGYQYHMKLHENIRKYKCPLEGCKKSFFLFNLLRKHMQMHSNVIVYPCNLCAATFKSVEALKYHRNTHEGSRNYLCTHCGKAFYQSIHLKDHINRHMGHKVFTCDICGKSFITNSQLSKHIKLCTRNKNKEI